MTARKTSPDDYYYLDALNNGHGPVTADFIRKLIHKTNILVWRPGLSDWILASHLPEFRRIHAVEADPSLAEMLDLCQNILADGTVTETEAAQLRDWLQAHPHGATVWPGNVIARRLADIFQDGQVTAAERADLKLLLDQITARRPDPQSVVAANPDAPFDKPPPHIGFHGRSFCFAGKFVFGSLERCHHAVTARGGTCHFEPVWDTHHLIVGALDPGRPLIEKAQKLKQLGSVCKIVAEEHWTKFVRQAPLHG